MTRTLRLYYAATAVFLALDYIFGINVRIAFLEPLPAARAAYYGVCFFCLALIVFRPGWAVFVGAFESLVTVVALILSMGLRVIPMNDAMLEGGGDIVSAEEIVNFVISGSIAYFAWYRGIHEISRQNNENRL